MSVYNEKNVMSVAGIVECSAQNFPDVIGDEESMDRLG